MSCLLRSVPPRVPTVTAISVVPSGASGTTLERTGASGKDETGQGNSQATAAGRGLQAGTGSSMAGDMTLDSESLPVWALARTGKASEDISEE